ncbi:MAG TPA: lactonase family protein [Polyangiaceae bacterium]|jgi:6-phosphogluconolactonase (cycloisomerase 2 family)
MKRALALAFLLACDAGAGAVVDASTEASASDAAPDAIATDASDAAARGPARVYVGASDGMIHVFAFDETSYALTPVDATPTGGNPSFLAFDAARAHLYAVDEVNSLVLAFAIDPKTGKLTSQGSVGSRGQGPAHVGLDRASELVMTANYGNGTIAVFPRAQDGTLGDASATHSFGATAETHEIVADPSNAFVLVPNKGLDGVAVFRRDGGALSYLGLTPAGGGARHIAFDPPGTHAYVVDENASMIVAFDFDPGSGALSQIQSLSSLYGGTVDGAANTGAEIQVTSDGKHVLASNRGDDSIVVFDIGPGAKLTPKARVSSGGQTPRQFQIEETGRFLFVGNQTSGAVVTMTMDAQSGVPSPVGTPVAITGPEFVGLVYLPP